VKVQQAKFNPTGLTDFKKDGDAKMIQQNLPLVCFCQGCRISREIKTLQIELNNYLTNKDGTSKMKLLKKALSLSRKEATCNFRIEYRMMKKGLWVNTQAPSEHAHI
jgi:hypothetical protein